ncbi:MAG: hypothetical protein IJZ53_13630 [Tyzzerella sp.]|nr:hypothetical protein [Tyzzerella sp.]
MQGETEERPRKRRKKKSRFGYYLYAVVVLLLTVANITLAILLLTHVQKIEVSGTRISTEEEIVAWVTEDPLTTNALYTLWKFNMGSYGQPVYLEDVKVSLGAPWKVQVDVTEKEIIACALYKESYVYFDKDGLVMQILPEWQEHVLLVENITVQDAKQFKVMKVKEEKLFSYIENITKTLRKNELSPDRVAWEDDSMNLYFGEVCVQLGKMNYDVKIAELPGILGGLEGEAGTLHMEHYSEVGEKISFEKFEAEEPEPVEVPETE